MSNKLLFAPLVALIMLYGCAAPQPQERITLLPQEGSRSSVVVQSKSGQSATLAKPYEVATVSDKQIRSGTSSETEVKSRYQSLYDALPIKAKSYLLFFDSGGVKLTAESQRQLQAVLEELKVIPAPELIVIGHADAVGSDELNDKLSLQRANAIFDMLKAKGIDTRRVSVLSRGRRDLMVNTKDGVAEARNRRVEIRLK